MNVFPAKADRWLVWVATVPTLGALAATLWSVYAVGARAIPGLLIALFASALGVSVVARTHYTIDGRMLLIRSGPFRWRVPIDEIDSITPTNDPSSAPAPSLDRLSIRYGAKEILISPRDRERFIETLRALNPKIA